MQQVSRSKGFTLIELSLAITFIAVLSIIVVIMISNAVSAYHKGLTLNQVNSTGMDLVDDMRTTVQDSPARSPMNECAEIYGSENKNGAEPCVNDKAQGFIYKERYAKVKLKNGSDTDAFEVPVYGVFCTGKYSYLWNSGYLFNENYKVVDNSVGNGLKLKFKDANGTVKDNVANFKLYKVQDSERLVCKIASGYVVGDTSGGSGSKYSNEFVKLTDNKIDISSMISMGEVADLLTGSSNLSIYDLTAAVPAENGVSNNAFYSVSFILGTVQGGVDVSALGCVAPKSGSVLENFDYCAINKFNFAATANGE